MSLTRATILVRSAEVHSLRQRVLRSATCVHYTSSARRRAEEKETSSKNVVNADKVNVPDQGPARHQQAARMSEEIKIIERDHPSPSFAEPDPNTLRPQGAGKAVDEEVLGFNTTTGRMGENPPAQNDVQSQQAMGIPMDGMQQKQVPADEHEGLSHTVDSGLEMHISHDDGDGQAAQTHAETTSTKGSTRPEPGAAEPISYESSLMHVTGTSTIAGRDFEGAVIDRIKTFATPHLRSSTSRGADGQRSPSSDAFSEDDQANAEKENTQRSLPQAARDALINKMVRGVYDMDEVFQKGLKSSRPEIQQIVKATLRNSTYSSKDTAKMIDKVASLLPSAPPQSKQKPGRPLKK